MTASHSERYLKIGDVAKQVGVSPSVIRSWENLGLARPERTESKYRLYTREDVKLLKQARFLRKVKGLNAAAIVQLLKREGKLKPANGAAAAVGTHLRQLRSKRKLSLSAVAKAVGVSVGFLSGLERSQMSASVGTLGRLANFYGTNILDFFDATDSSKPLVRPAGRKILEAASGVRMELLAWGGKAMEPHLFRLAPGAGSGEAYQHEGEDFLYVLRGRLAITLADKAYQLIAGDSFYFESTTPHQWTNPGKTETWVLWVNTPPTF
jgi:DNA-binding transcriptional MerR regulator/mannose-6-phosphate isomerase-like protein (cupin superfamily)